MTTTSAQALPRTLTTRQVAVHLGVCADKVLNWIRSGELRAIDVANRGSTRPRYRIDPGDLVPQR